jgi:hypothetical protein
LTKTKAKSAQPTDPPSRMLPDEAETMFPTLKRKNPMKKRRKRTRRKKKRRKKRNKTMTVKLLSLKPMTMKTKMKMMMVITILPPRTKLTMII